MCLHSVSRNRSYSFLLFFENSCFKEFKNLNKLLKLCSIVVSYINSFRIILNIHCKQLSWYFPQYIPIVAKNFLEMEAEQNILFGNTITRSYTTRSSCTKLMKSYDRFDQKIGMFVSFLKSPTKQFISVVNVKRF